MDKIIVGIVGRIITSYACTILIANRLLSKKEYLRLKNFIIILLAIPILNITNNFNMTYKIIAVIIIYTMIIKLIFNKGVILSFIICTFAYSIGFLCDVINSFLYLVVFSIDIVYIQQHLYMIYIMHFSFLIIAIIMSLFIRPKNIFNEIEDFILKKSLGSVVQYIVFVITFIGLLGYVIFVQPYLSKEHIASVVLLILFIIMNITYFYQIKIFTKSKHDYDNIYIYTREMEKLTHQLTVQEHEYKNRLVGIQGLIENNQYDEALKFVKSIMPEKEEYEELFAINYDKIHNTVLKKILIEKTSKALSLGVKINALVRKEIDDINIPIVDLNDIISIIMDNAIDAADKASEKIIDIMIDCDDDEVNIIVANTYQKMIEEVALYKEGTSSKGLYRGNGLYLLKQIEDNNSNMIIDTTITEEFFIQEIRIKNL